MDDRRIGAVFRAVRQHHGLRQSDVAARAGVSQASVSTLERGRLARVSLPIARRIADVLDIRLSLNAWWRGGEADKLLDRAHAALVERVTRVLRASGWHVIVEFPFGGAYGRGSVDVLGWHPARRALCIVEVKSRILDLQELLMTFARKVRLVPLAVREDLGWRPAVVGRVLVVAGTTANREVVAAHPNVFGASFPHRAREARPWLRRPIGDLSAVWFIPPEAVGTDGRRTAPQSRVRKVAGCRSSRH
jgi:transcriptional regulator with XRE-family HTH domain